MLKLLKSKASTLGKSALKKLSPGGKIVIISSNSLVDRKVVHRIP